MTSDVMPTFTVEVSEAEVRGAIEGFAEAVAETPEFQAYEQAAARLRQDAAAQRAMEAFQTKQQSLQTMLMFNMLSAEEQAELERLRQAFLSEPSVAAYFQAQEDLSALCQAAADLLSRRIGLSFAAACGPGCC